MTGQLASLLRSSLDTAATPLVPLEHELKTVTDYLGIERVRFGDRLRYDIEVDRGLEDVAVPRLSLQTLVENSVKYAVSPSRSGAMIQVRARRENDRLHLEVEDDGPGFEPESEPPGHGLALLRERLRMTCGASGVLIVRQHAGHTVVRMEIPAMPSGASATP
jgi:LytS/YehU family sensor histidine kinase